MKRDGENTQKNYTKKKKKCPNDPGNHDGVITHLEADILECEVKCKASGDDKIPAELFQILKDDAVKYCTQYASKFGKLSSGHRTGKGQFSFIPVPKKGSAKEFSDYHTVALTSHASKVMLKILQARLQ